MSVHPTASQGYAVAGSDYERARPAYPPAALELLHAELGLGPASVVVELGAGTGKLTRMLAPMVGTLVATEPVDAMRAELAAAVATPVVVAAAEAVPLDAECADAVVVATAFHWFRGREALAEVERVLRPGGGLGLLWNNPDRDTDWVRRIWEMVDEHRGATPGNRDLRWQEAFSTATGLTPLEHRVFRHAVEMDVEALVQRVASISFIAALAPAERDAVLRRVGSIVRGRSRFELPYRTEVYWCRRRGPAGGPS
ncbi:MAG TPA: methyltransferase domain-containing protein [Acidimicrobiales bacterium]|nr:methyltransferase domain-containing protein [Acidimicrobiales bacterium]